MHLDASSRVWMHLVLHLDEIAFGVHLLLELCLDGWDAVAF